ncbi:MAG: FtsQ-type POTRA domain-containing protein [Candidatus Omnitrophica bacterium]|nr:FtsQ-type POTRA domain-containing protein [Candidatus Omnitrophota bacterium]
MARKKRTRKPKKRSRRSKGSSAGGFPSRLFVTALVAAVLMGGAVYGVWYFFLNSEFFAVRDIIVNKDQDYSFHAGERYLLNRYKGRNIFTVNARQVQTLVKSDYPQFKKVEIRRRFPDVLEVDIVSREPMAIIESGGGIVIDSEGVVLNVGEVRKGLVKVRGISFFLNMPERGEKITSGALDRALLLLEILRKKMGSEKANIEYIDISDRNNLVLGIYGAKVKMGSEDFFKKTQQLRDIINDPNINMDDIRYIDLRFDDAVIAPK